MYSGKCTEGGQRLKRIHHENGRITEVQAIAPKPPAEKEQRMKAKADLQKPRDSGGLEWNVVDRCLGQ